MGKYSLFLLCAQLDDTKLLINKIECIDQLWINLFKENNNNQSYIEEILNTSLHNETILTPQVALIVDELIQQGKEDIISILFPYIIKRSNEVLPIVYRWFTDDDHSQIKQLAAILLAEVKHIFEAAIDTIIDLMKSNDDQMRYRAQRIFQHPERSPNEPSRKISVIGEKTLIKILENLSIKEHLPRVRSYIGSFLFDLLWDDPLVFQNLYETTNQVIYKLVIVSMKNE
ncbi:unnamed protein product [Rotaria sp. Silwood2]|nr:unnamed protein product [Rotaria sp. Silwood2]